MTSVIAIVFACAAAYMGVGFVDPILPEISQSLKATPTQAELLFASYLFVTAFTMFISSWVSSHLGQKKTLLLGLGIILVFALGCALAGNINSIIGFRGGWGIGNALFVSTALATILGIASNYVTAIVLYESSVGIGLAFGPLLGGLLGEISWRGPFFGTTALMAIGFVGILFGVGKTPAPKEKRSIATPFKAVFHKELVVFMLATLIYNWAFFGVLAYAPFPVHQTAANAGITLTPIDLGFVFFGWGSMLAIFSVFVSPRLTKRFGTKRTIVATMVILAIVLIILVLTGNHFTTHVIFTIISGAAIGILNTSLTEVAAKFTTYPRDVITSSYSGMRFVGGAISATAAGPIAAAWGLMAPYVVCIIAVFLSLALIVGAHLAASPRWKKVTETKEQ